MYRGVTFSLLKVFLDFYFLVKPILVWKIFFILQWDMYTFLIPF